MLFKKNATRSNYWSNEKKLSHTVDPEKLQNASDNSIAFSFKLATDVLIKYITGGKTII